MWRLSPRSSLLAQELWGHWCSCGLHVVTRQQVGGACNQSGSSLSVCKPPGLVDEPVTVSQTPAASGPGGERQTFHQVPKGPHAPLAREQLSETRL